MEQKEGEAESGSRSSSIPQIGQSCDAPTAFASKRQSVAAMSQEAKRLKPATEASGSAHSTTPVVPGDSVEVPTPTNPDTNAKPSLPEAWLPVGSLPPVQATLIPASAALSYAVNALSLDVQRLASENERLGAQAAENRALRAQVDALQSHQAEATQGYL